MQGMIKGYIFPIKKNGLYYVCTVFKRPGHMGVVLDFPLFIFIFFYFHSSIATTPRFTLSLLARGINLTCALHVVK